MATAALESPGVLGDPTEPEEAIYACKACGEILEEGKAYELAGGRWHIDCFRCHNCKVMLDSESNLLLLGDGSLICPNCTYSCSACGNKIEELAILTGDQSYCAACFKCRNCKRKIENLRYARTSQGIFCMSCHESLMARRRKKNKAQRAPSANSNSSSNRPDKALPDLPKSPPSGEPKSAFSPDEESVTSADGTIKSRKEGGYVDYKHPSEDDKATVPSSVPPSSTYTTTRSPSSASRADPTVKANDDDFYMPITLDPSSPNDAKFAARSPQNRLGPSEDYKGDFKDLGSASSAARSTSQEGRTGNKPSYPSPHIAYQEKGRQASGDAVVDSRVQRNASTTSPPAASMPSKAFTSPSLTSDTEAFKLQEAPRRRSSGSRGATVSPAGPNPSQLDGHGSRESPRTAAQDSSVSRPVRGDSLNRNNLKQSVPDRKAVPRADSELEEARRQLETTLEDPAISPPFNVSSSHHNNGGPPPRSASRPGAVEPAADFTAPRSAPIPPKHKNSESVTSIQSDGHFSPREPDTPLPPHTATGSYSMEDEMSRMLRDEDGEHPGIFRKMSKAVKHGRSYSDKIGPAPSPKWSKGSRNGSVEISSPIISGSGAAAPADDVTSLRSRLRYAEQKIAELEAEKMKMEEGLNGTAELQQMNSELRQKRSTMAFLDSQKEIVSRELDVMSEHVSKAKHAKTPIDIEKFKEEIHSDLMNSLKRLKDQQSAQIEDLISKKNALTQEITTLIQMKDKGFQEYESLSSKNRELREMNERVIESIQQMSEHGKVSGSNALGIYAGRDGLPPGALQTDMHSVQSNDPTASVLTGDTAYDSPTVMNAPKVVDIRKAPPKKFNWKKGGDRFKTVSKGLKGAFSGAQTNSARDEQFTETLPYGSQQAGAPPTIGDLPAQGGRGDKRGFFGQLGAQGNPRIGSPVSAQVSENGALFGSDLTGRCDVEQRVIPYIVMRCIAEVESRGLDNEGIYRKSGSTSMVNAIRSGFEATDKNDISDPDIDIHAVTSCLKQYLRKLPIPLITWDAYDPLLAAAAQEDKNERIYAFRKVVADLPDRHRDTLEYLIDHLCRVVDLEPQNLMTPTNVAVVFAPTIMRPRQLEREISDMELQRKSVEHLLRHSKAIFDRPSN